MGGRNSNCAALRRLAAFAGCTDEELSLVNGTATLVRIRRGTVIAEAGTVARECCVIDSGLVEVTADGRRIAVLAEGDWVGEMAVLKDQARCATAVAASDATMLVFTAGEFRHLVRRAPGIAVRVSAGAAHRHAANEARAGARRQAARRAHPAFSLAM